MKKANQKVEIHKSIKWLHLSDVHFSGKNSYDQNRLVSALLKSLPNLILRFGSPDFVFFTGDIAHSGKAEEYREAEKFFEHLLSTLGLDRKRLLLVPGNHDVDRVFNAGLSREFKNRRDIDDMFGGNSVYQIEKRQNAFKEWYEGYFTDRQFPQNSTTYIIENFEKFGFPIEVYGINSAAFSFDDEDQGKLILSQRCIEEIGKSQRTDGSLRIGLIHHPLSWISEVERIPVKAAISDAFDLLLHGHLHDNEVEIAQGSSGHSITIASGALYQGSNWPNVANFATLSGCDLTVHPIRYHDSPREIWTQDTALFPNDPEYAGRFFVQRRRRDAAGELLPVESTSIDQILSADNLSGGWQSGLFMAPSGKVIYTEPRLCRKPQSAALEFDETIDAISIADFLSCGKSYVIDTRSEYGGSTLLGRISTELTIRGISGFLGDARTLPNYKKKLFEIISNGKKLEDKSIVVLLDNVDLERDRKMISELGRIECVSRVIAVCANRGLTPASGIVLQEIGLQFEQLHLWTLSRAQIRELAVSFFDTDDFEMTSLVTQKIYDDLLGLCIPLTPNNVIMYMKILFVDGNFIPINRVDILQKFLMDSLRRPSDSFTGSFNYRNKIEVVAEFSKLLFKEKKGSFSQKDWLEFCDEFKFRTLLGFNSNLILDEILEARIFARSGDRFYFRYGFFYSFALGSALNSDQDALDGFLQDSNYTSVSDVLDVVTALSPNNDRIIDTLRNDLASALRDFEEQVVKENFDPLIDALWASNDKEDEQTWQPITKAISEGPERPEKIDILKSSYLAEARTVDQEVTIRKFQEIEYKLVIILKNLIEVLKNVNDVGRDKKVDAYEMLIRAELCSFQVGTLFAPELAKSRFYRWGAIAFLDFDKAAKNLDPKSAEAISNVVVSLSRAVATKSRQDLAFQKLGGIFADRALRSVSVGFLEVLNFYHLIGGRAEGWEKAAEHLLEKASPGSLYLFIMLRGIMDELKHDVVRISDRSKLKRLVAYTRAKRMYVVSKPSDQQIAKLIQKMSKEELLA